MEPDKLDVSDEIEEERAEGEPRFPAQDIWSTEMRDAGAPWIHWWPDSLDPELLARALERAGFTAVRTRLERFDHRHDPARFLELRKALAAPWLAGLAASERDALLGRIEGRLAALGPDDYLDPTRILVVSGRAG